MLLLSLRTALVIILLASLSSTASAQTGNAEGAAANNFKSRVFDIKHRDPDSLLNVIRPLAGASKDASISRSDEFKTITVRDTPENLEVIAEAIKRYDTPEGLQPNVELRMHILLASKTEGTGNTLPTELIDATRQVASSLDYKSFYHVTSIAQRLRDGARKARGRGVVNLGAPAVKEPFNAGYEFHIDSISLETAASLPSTIKIREMQFGLGGSKNPLGEASIRTDLTMRDGEQVVVGTASLKDKALVLVLFARIIK